MSELADLGSNFKPLIGTDEATIDSKGRILLGKKKRDRLGEPFAMALGTLGGLVAYPESVWRGMFGEIMQYSYLNQGRQQYTRLFLGLADDDLRFDPQGRVVVPQKLRELGKLNKEVLIIGAGDRVEIWAKEEWEEFNRNPDTYAKQRREAIEKAYTQMTGKSLER